MCEVIFSFPGTVLIYEETKPGLKSEIANSIATVSPDSQGEQEKHMSMFSHLKVSSWMNHHWIFVCIYWNSKLQRINLSLHGLKVIHNFSYHSANNTKLRCMWRG